MRKFTGQIQHIVGRGDVLVTRIPTSDKLPKKGSRITVNGESRKVRDIELTLHGDTMRGELVGIVLHAEKCVKCGK
jgi:hypothetical protein